MRRAFSFTLDKSKHHLVYVLDLHLKCIMLVSSSCVFDYITLLKLQYIVNHVLINYQTLFNIKIRDVGLTAAVNGQQGMSTPTSGLSNDL